MTQFSPISLASLASFLVLAALPTAAFPNCETVLIPPYGGKLIDLRATGASLEEALAVAAQAPSVTIADRFVHDLELLAVGAFSPLDGFMGKADYQGVLDGMRLSSGHVFPMPILLPVAPNPDITLGKTIALRDSHNNLLATLKIEEIFEWDRDEFATKVLGTQDSLHPLVSELKSWGSLAVSGKLTVLKMPPHGDFGELRLTPAETRARLEAQGNATVVAFQTRNPIHRAHEQLTKEAMARTGGNLLIHPAVGMTKPGDVDHYSRVRAYQALVNNYYDPSDTLLALFPLAMRMAGPREALWHAIIRRNYGASHFIVGRDHAGPGRDSKGDPFYGPYDAQALVAQYAAEIGVQVVTFEEMVYLPDEDRYVELSAKPAGARTLSLSGTQVRDDYLAKGRDLPPWFTRPEVAQVLAQTFPPRNRQGFVVWFTGLSGSGKSTTADILTELLLEKGRRITLLDGDVVRTQLTKGLGFSREDRDTNVRRVGYVASEIARHGGAVVTALISPYRATRDEIRKSIGSDQMVEVFVDTPLEECEARDVKCLYAQARAGKIKEFTGISDPYEMPLNPELTLDTKQFTAEQNARKIVEYLVAKGFVDP
jgi:sulfate adenylyltransferase